MDLPCPRWAIVLAGGDGTRLTSYVERRFGEPRPKQYCAFSGPRSMLQHTIDRAVSLTGAAERTVTIVAASHERWSTPQLAGHPGQVIVQALNRGTGPGVFLPLAWVRARDPNAVVYLLPSDHYVLPHDRFVEAVTAAGNAAGAYPDHIVLAAVTPDGPESEYGYIEPDGPEASLRPVARFVEKPSPEAAARAISRGALWNTMVLAARVDTLWDAGRACLPEMMAHFDLLVDMIDTPFERAALHDVYLAMPNADFSRDVLERVPSRCLVARLDGIEWSDWGRAERVEATIARFAAPNPRPPLALVHAGR